MEEGSRVHARIDVAPVSTRSFCSTGAGVSCCGSTWARMHPGRLVSASSMPILHVDRLPAAVRVERMGCLL
jgi:hypothetical protein